MGYRILLAVLCSVALSLSLSYSVLADVQITSSEASPGGPESPLARPFRALVGGASAASEPAAGARIVSVDIVGNAHVAAAAVDAAITSKVGEPFSEERVECDREAIRRLGWFQRVEAVRESMEDGVRVTFRVVENPVITDIQFAGIRMLARDQLLAVMQTRPGSVYNPYVLAKDAQAIEDVYRKRG